MNLIRSASKSDDAAESKGVFYVADGKLTLSWTSPESNELRASTFFVIDRKRSVGSDGPPERHLAALLDTYKRITLRNTTFFEGPRQHVPGQGLSYTEPWVAWKDNVSDRSDAHVKRLLAMGSQRGVFDHPMAPPGRNTGLPITTGTEDGSGKYGRSGHNDPLMGKQSKTGTLVNHNGRVSGLVWDFNQYEASSRKDTEMELLILKKALGKVDRSQLPEPRSLSSTGQPAQQPHVREISRSSRERVRARQSVQRIHYTISSDETAPQAEMTKNMYLLALGRDSDPRQLDRQVSVFRGQGFSGYDKELRQLFGAS